MALLHSICGCMLLLASLPLPAPAHPPLPRSHPHPLPKGQLVFFPGLLPPPPPHSSPNKRSYSTAPQDRSKQVSYGSVQAQNTPIRRSSSDSPGGPAFDPQLRRSGENHISQDTPVSLYDTYNSYGSSYGPSYGYNALSDTDMSANHHMHNRNKRFIFKLRNIALPLTIFHYLGFLPMRVPGLPYHIDPGLPDHNPYEPYNELHYPQEPLRNRRYRVARRRNN